MLSRLTFMFDSRLLQITRTAVKHRPKSTLTKYEWYQRMLVQVYVWQSCETPDVLSCCQADVCVSAHTSRLIYTCQHLTSFSILKPIKTYEHMQIHIFDAYCTYRIFNLVLHSAATRGRHTPLNTDYTEHTHTHTHTHRERERHTHSLTLFLTHTHTHSGICVFYRDSP